ncbi:MAG: cytochrome b/b6 domain-containing protein [Deltaproteobacteria bacterium]|nr:cytochrome b/b6 domain-containing protein [Deltaproteobacteria bacterium]
MNAKTNDEATRVRRFTPLQRFFHGGLLAAFIVQGATGLGRMSVETGWGKGLCRLFGGYESALVLHKIVGILMIAGFLIHMVYLLVVIDWRRFPRMLLGPDSLVPSPRDARQFFEHLGWFFGVRPHPEFDRWGYWEKFDYWAVFWGMVILGISGLLLAFPVASSRMVPGWGLNVALWVHRIEALLAMAHVFIIHFFVAHVRRHSFPMDRAMFEGTVDLESTRREKPAWLARLKEAGRFEERLATEAPPFVRAASYLFGFVAMAAGIALLVGAVINLPRITW